MRLCRRSKIELAFEANGISGDIYAVVECLKSEGRLTIRTNFAEFENPSNRGCKVDCTVGDDQVEWG